MDDEAKSDESGMGQAIFEQVTNLYVRPEVERRRAAGTVPEEFDLWAVQIVMNVDAPVGVRLNDEAKYIAEVKVARPVQRGEAVRVKDVDELKHIELTDDDPDAGHITMIRTAGHWAIQFDFTYNSGRAHQTLDVAKDFLESAREAVAAGRQRVAVDNLYSAVELAAKATLLPHPDKTLFSSKTHGLVSRKFNRWAKLGNTDQRFADLLNRLGQLRPRARYGLGSLALAEGELEGMLAVAKEMIAQGRERVTRRLSRDGDAARPVPSGRGTEGESG